MLANLRSYIATAAAFDTFKEPSELWLGILTSISQCDLVLSLRPGPSAPRTKAIGPAGKLLTPLFRLMLADPSSVLEELLLDHF